VHASAAFPVVEIHRFQQQPPLLLKFSPGHKEKSFSFCGEKAPKKSVLICTGRTGVVPFQPLQPPRNMFRGRHLSAPVAHNNFV